MADAKISQLPVATSSAGTDVLPIVQSSTTKQLAIENLVPQNLKSNATTGVLQVTGPAAGTTRVMTAPNANFTAARTDAAQSFTGDQTLGTGNLVIGTSGKGIVDSTNTISVNFTSTGIGIGTTAPNKQFSVSATDPQIQFQSNNLFVTAGASFGACTWYSSDASTSSTGVLAQIDAVANRNFDGDQAVTGMDFRILTAPLSSKNSPIERVRVGYDGSFNCPGIYSYTVGATNRDVYVDSTGYIGYVTSIQASKTEIQPLTDTSWIYQLTPVSFKYRKKDNNGNYTEEADGGLQYGLIAEDVELIRADLCFYDQIDGQQVLRGVQYSKLIPLLLKEIQNLKSQLSSLKGA